MKIKCIDKGDCKGLTEGKVYETDRELCLTYCTINDFGHKENYFTKHFEVINE